MAGDVQRDRVQEVPPVGQGGYSALRGPHSSHLVAVTHLITRSHQVVTLSVDCPSRWMGRDEVLGEEDCLTLNVHSDEVR